MTRQLDSQRRKVGVRMFHQHGRMFTIHEACDLIDRGYAFADVAPYLNDRDDEEQLRFYFVYRRLPDREVVGYPAYEDTPPPRPLLHSKEPQRKTPARRGNGKVTVVNVSTRERPHVTRLLDRSSHHEQGRVVHHLDM